VLAGLGFIATEAQIDKSMYGRDVDRREILDGKVAAPASARMLPNLIRNLETVEL